MCGSTGARCRSASRRATWLAFADKVISSSEREFSKKEAVQPMGLPVPLSNSMIAATVPSTSTASPVSAAVTVMAWLGVAISTGV